MTLAFDNKELRKICESKEYAASLYDGSIVETLLERLADIEAADNPLELLTGSPCEIIYKGKNCYKVNITNDIRIIFTTSTKKSNNTDWSCVNRVKILNIESL